MQGFIEAFFDKKIKLVYRSILLCQIGFHIFTNEQITIKVAFKNMKQHKNKTLVTFERDKGSTKLQSPKHIKKGTSD